MLKLIILSMSSKARSLLEKVGVDSLVLVKIWAMVVLDEKLTF